MNELVRKLEQDLDSYKTNQGYKNDEKESRKDDKKDNKPMWQLFPLAELSGVVDVYTAGAKKYGENRWQNLEDGENRYFAAMCRHWVEHLRGNEIDQEDGCLHIDKCIWNLIAVRHCFLENNCIDPRTTNYEKLWKKNGETL